MAIWLAVLGTLAAAGLPTAEVRNDGGVPALFIDGQAHPATSYMTYAPNGKNFKAMGAVGVHLYSFSATPTESTYNLAPLCWVNPDTYDYTAMDERAHMVLDNDPEAWFFPRIYLGTPAWWAEAHPDDLVLADAGDGVPRVFLCYGEKRVASWASEQWRRDTAEAIRRFIRHVEASDYGDRVIGYHIASGTTEEWMQWGSNENEWGDYSPVNAARFRGWLRKNYGADAALQKAWNNPEVTLESAAIPSRPQRGAGEIGLLRDPATAQPSIDYVLYNSWLTADTIRAFARVVKEATDGRRLVGVFYGYLLQLAGEQREQNAGHLAFEDVVTCPDIDFITSPSSYVFRQLGTGFPHTMSLVDSVKLHGKLWFDENDFRTWLTPNTAVGQYGKTATYEESLLAQQREFAWVLTNRLGMWWFDMGGGWYDDPRMLAEIGHMERAAETCVGVDGRPVAEVAFVVDDTSSAYVTPGNPYGWAALIQQLPELGRIGAPFDVVYLGDLPILRPYKLYIFPNCLAPTDEERALIAEKVRHTGAAVVWIGPAGLYRNGQLDPAAMETLTGVPLKLETRSAPYVVAPTEKAAAWGWEHPVSFAPERDFGAIALPAQGWGDVLGVLEGTDVPALAGSDKHGITVFSSVPKLPEGFLRALARRAGVHLYIDTPDIVWASRELLAVSVNEGGKRTIHLAAPASVVDLWTGKTQAENVRDFDVDIPAKGTALLRLHSRVRDTVLPGARMEEVGNVARVQQDNAIP